MTLKDFIHHFKHQQEIFDLKERHGNDNLVNKNFFFNNYTVDIFLFVTAIISLVVMTIGMYILCKTHETEIFSGQSCFTANKRSRYSS